eukprot:CAMPEP_0172298952 /NCGR_PEP_ID=MMETSP1058-20130122/1368_1 /TAXON_ID=83371 /ORGANISM="Detonula confervacea, Strain CCMP 353" /LENGTH=191 /DNA_ID=CAMNT_0013008247 /DNA_START=29 /DNA_END=604 /DNA_ORIENTATION=-
MATSTIGSAPSNRYLLLLMALLSMQSSTSFTPSLQTIFPSISRSSHHTIITAAAAASSDDGNIDPRRKQKRLIIASALAIVPFLGWNTQNPTIISPQPANALQEKNEALCNTGFFTNIGAWYCTDIGNIGDEGKAKPMSGQSEASLDSLMSKFDLDGGDGGDDKKGETNNQAGKGGMEKNGDRSQVANKGD